MPPRKKFRDLRTVLDTTPVAAAPAAELPPEVTVEEEPVTSFTTVEEKPVVFTAVVEAVVEEAPTLPEKTRLEIEAGKACLEQYRDK